MDSFTEALSRRNQMAFDRAQYRYDHMEPPDNSEAEEAFDRWCEEEGVDPETEDFAEWLESQYEDAMVQAAEDRAEDMRQNPEYYEPAGWEP